MKKKAQEGEEEAKEIGDVEAQKKFKTRNIKLDNQMIEDCKKMLRLLGFPIYEAKAEAEAQCAELVKKGKVFAVATEDMDCLTFGATIQLKGLFKFNNKD